MSRKIVLELNDETFGLLEALAFGLHLEDPDLNETGYVKSRDDFGDGVRRLLVDAADSMAAGVRRPGSWERGTVESLTGWQGTYNWGMLADCVKPYFPAPSEEEQAEWRAKMNK